MEVRAFTIGTPRGLAEADAKIEVGGPALRVVPNFKFEVVDDDQDFNVQMWVEFDRSHMQYQVGQLTITSLHGAGGVTGTMLRQVRVLDYLRMGARHGIFVQTGDEIRSLAEMFGTGRFFGREGAAGIRQMGPTDAVIGTVGLIYVSAHLASTPPAKAVQDELGLPPRTATNWISKARERGWMRGLPEVADES